MTYSIWVILFCFYTIINSYFKMIHIFDKCHTIPQTNALRLQDRGRRSLFSISVTLHFYIIVLYLICVIDSKTRNFRNTTLIANYLKQNRYSNATIISCNYTKSIIGYSTHILYINTKKSTKCWDICNQLL